MSQESWENLSGIWDNSLTTLAIAPEFSQSAHFLKSLSHLVVFTPQKNDFEKFSHTNAEVMSDFPTQKFQQVLFVPKKNKMESLAYIKMGIDLLENGGEFFFACDNDSGAKSFMTQIRTLDDSLEFESKRKSRFVSFTKEQLKTRADILWIEGFDYQLNSAGFISFPGIYGWNKIDHASRLLLSTMPKLRGQGADFGSGYGYITSQIDLSQVSKMHLLENDLRALECSRRNLQAHPQCVFHWADIIQDKLELPMLDFIVMNPPFHEGKEVQQDLGLGFIKKAREFLKKDGHLFLVANQFLPYEDTLISQFGRMTKVLKQDGFKVLHV